MQRLDKQRLLNRAKELETMISIYSDRDRVRMVELEMELFDVNMQLLDIMSEETRAA